MTPFSKVYDAFKARILEDDWINWEEELVALDLRQILESAIPRFKFPRVSLARTDEGFTEDLEEEVQILGAYMAMEWLDREILTWENVKPLYDEADFSPANKLAQLIKLSASTRDTAKKLEANYYRSIKGKPYPYRNLAGKNEDNE